MMKTNPVALPLGETDEVSNFFSICVYLRSSAVEPPFSS
jgi:hypothetical protein